MDSLLSMGYGIGNNILCNHFSGDKYIICAILQNHVDLTYMCGLLFIAKNMMCMHALM